MKKEEPRDEFLKRRAERQRKRRKKRIITTFIVSLIMLVTVLIVLSLTVFFKIEYIEINGSAIYNSETLEEASGVKLGDNLWTVSKAEILRKLSSELPYIETVEIKRELPSKLIVKVTDAEEFICYEEQSGFYIVSKKGWVLKKVTEQPEDIVIIKGADAECKEGSAIVFKEESQKELVNKLTELCGLHNVSASQINVSDSVSLELMIENRISVKLGTINFAEEKIKHLASMLEQIPEEQGGKINLSMWNNDNPQGTFTPGVAE